MTTPADLPHILQGFSSGLEPLASVTVTAVVVEKGEGRTFEVSATGVHVAKRG